jgi:hypothetical protein
MEKMRIIIYPKGKYGYKKFFELQVWNSTYKKWYSIKEALALEFIESYCIMNKLDYKSIMQQEIKS